MFFILKSSFLAAILASIFISVVIIIVVKTENKKALSHDHKPLQNKIITEYFEIEIHYNMVCSGGVSATFIVVKNPKGVKRVIYDGGSWCLESSFQDYFVIKEDTIEDLQKKVSSTIYCTKEKILMVEKNLEAVETNKLMLEVDDS